MEAKYKIGQLIVTYDPIGFGTSYGVIIRIEKLTHGIVYMCTDTITGGTFSTPERLIVGVITYENYEYHEQQRAHKFRVMQGK